MATSLAHHSQAHGERSRISSASSPSVALSVGPPVSVSVSVSASAASPSAPKRFYKKRKARSILRRFKHYAVKHTWVLPLAILSAFVCLYAIHPSEENPINHFIFLSYKLPSSRDLAPGEPPHYSKGRWDIAFVVFYALVLSFTREFIMQEVLRPLARHVGLRSRGKQARFMEQSYSALYFGILGPAGIIVMSRTPVWYFNTSGMYEDFPHKTLDAAFKFYYLFQAAYWAQQAVVLVLGMEKPRKDFKQLIAHHIISLFLIALSYRFHFTYMGLAVYITHDVSDFFLATSKTLNYLDHPIVEAYFFLFMCVWVYTRHYLNWRILLSMFNEFKTVGPYELNWETEQYKCELAFWITLLLLLALQSLNLFWLFYIFRIAFRFVVHKTADDDRSEANDSDFEEQQQQIQAEKTVDEEKDWEKRYHSAGGVKK